MMKASAEQPFLAFQKVAPLCPITVFALLWLDWSTAGRGILPQLGNGVNDAVFHRFGFFSLLLYSL